MPVAELKLQKDQILCLMGNILYRSEPPFTKLPKKSRACEDFTTPNFNQSDWGDFIEIFNGEEKRTPHNNIKTNHLILPINIKRSYKFYCNGYEDNKFDKEYSSFIESTGILRDIVNADGRKYGWNDRRFNNLYYRKDPYMDITGPHTEIRTFYRINRVHEEMESRDTKVSIEEGSGGWAFIFPWFGNIDLSQIPEDKRRSDDEKQINDMKNTREKLASTIESNPKALRYEISVEKNSGPHTLFLPTTCFDKDYTNIFLDLDLKGYGTNNTLWQLNMQVSNKILEDINPRVKPLEEGGVLLELFPEKERSSYKIKLLGFSGHQLVFLKPIVHKNKTINFLGRILKSFSTFEPLPEKVEIEWEIYLPQPNDISYGDLIDIIKKEFPNLNLLHSSSHLRVESFYEANISKTIYLTKKDNGLVRIIESDHRNDRVIFIEEDYTYLCKL